LYRNDRRAIVCHTQLRRVIVARMALSTARTLPALRDEYVAMYNSMTIRPERLAAVDSRVRRITANEARYRSVADPAGVPWYVVGIIHSLEGGGFGAHLHNGDPLTARTTHVPVGRPLTGNPPFTWEESARDAIAMRGWNASTDWSLPGVLYQLEKYNGFGYRPIGIASPYLWSFSNHYTRGKFASDNRFDPNLVSQQAGAATILRRMMDLDASGVGTQTKTLWPYVVSAAVLIGAAVLIAYPPRR
jgi:lysozyme family protein